MRYPSMIIFDYGHTLLYEPDYDPLRGERALFEHIKSNPNGYTAEQVNDFAQRIYEEIAPARNLGFQLHEWQFQRFVYEYLGIELSISQSEAENIFWDAMTPGALMPGADKMLDYLNAEGIRTGVISNIAFSGDALRRRLDRLLPNNRFEFVITSSEYMFIKPSRLIFELALQKAQLSADDVWYCGDNPAADVEGAASVGIFPVWYDCDIDCWYRDRENEPSPTCGHLHIREWDELIGALDSCNVE